MFPLGVLLLLTGYAVFYTGAANMLNGSQGPTLSQALGFKTQIQPPSGIQPANLTGQPASTNAPTPPVQTSNMRTYNV